MTRYQYSRFHRHEPSYRVKFQEVVIGECWSDEVLWGRRSPGERKRWYARIYTDPTVIGKGKTKDDAVDDVYRQTGGPD